MHGPENQELFIKPIIGYRAWHLSATGKLRSAIMDHEWVAGENQGICLRPSLNELLVPGQEAPAHGKVPEPNCQCGLYAHYEKESLTDFRAPLISRVEAFPFNITGSIIAWGRVQAYADGFRAEKAKVVALTTPASTPEFAKNIIESVADSYGVPLLVPGELEEYTLKFGAPLPLNSRPERPKPPVIPPHLGSSYPSPYGPGSYDPGADDFDIIAALLGGIGVGIGIARAWYKKRKP